MANTVKNVVQGTIAAVVGAMAAFIGGGVLDTFISGQSWSIVASSTMEGVGTLAIFGIVLAAVYKGLGDLF